MKLFSGLCIFIIPERNWWRVPASTYRSDQGAADIMQRQSFDATSLRSMPARVSRSGYRKDRRVSRLHGRWVRSFCQSALDFFSQNGKAVCQCQTRCFRKNLVFESLLNSSSSVSHASSALAIVEGKRPLKIDHTTSRIRRPYSVLRYNPRAGQGLAPSVATVLPLRSTSKLDCCSTVSPLSPLLPKRNRWVYVL